MSRRGRSGGGGHDGGEERWLLPYSDMITLLLGLFIVLFAMSSIDAKQFDNVKRSLSQTFNGQVLEEPGGLLPGSTDVLDPTAASDSEAMRVLQISEATRRVEQQFQQETRQLKQVIEKSSLGNDVKVTRNEVGITVSLAGDALFAPGSWELRGGVVDDITRIEREMERFRHHIEIAGHTDGQPYAGEWGNWGLSANRANEVGALFRRLGFPPARMRTSGFADSRPAVKPPSRGASVAANRRIEITILEPGANDGFPNARPARGSSAAAAATPSTDPVPAAAQVEAAVEQEFDSVDIVQELADTSQGQ